MEFFNSKRIFIFSQNKKISEIFENLRKVEDTERIIINRKFKKDRQWKWPKENGVKHKQ